MLYAVGTRIDLRHLNPPRQIPEIKKVRSGYSRYVEGTRISFLKMTRGLTIMDIVEPPIALRVAVGA